MLDRKKFVITWWDKVKIGLGIMALLLVIVQIASAVKMINQNHTEVPMITSEQYAGLNIGDVMAAEIKKEDIIMSFIGSNDTLSYYLVKVSDDHAVIMRMVQGGSCDNSMYAMLAGKIDSITYKGKVNILVEPDMAEVNLLVLSGDLLYKKGMSRHLNDVILRYTLDIALYDTTAGPKYIIATIVGAFLMLGVAVWAFWKPFKKIGLGYAARLGKIDLNLMTKDDLPVDMDWYTDEKAKKDYVDSLPERKIDENFKKVDFYESSINDEGNFYVKKQIQLDKKESDDEDGFKHKHMNY